MASRGNDVITPALSESLGRHSRTATSGVLTVYRCMVPKMLLCIHSDGDQSLNASELMVNAWMLKIRV